MPREITFYIEGRSGKGREGDSLLAGLLNEGIYEFREEGDHGHSPICGMGICFECLVFVKGRGQVRACMVPLEEGMEVTF